MRWCAAKSPLLLGNDLGNMTSRVLATVRHRPPALP